MVSPRQFADWYRHANPPQAGDGPDTVDAAFKQYRRDFHRRTAQTFFDEMSGKPWFREKYSPAEDMVELRARQRAKADGGRVDKFLSELKEGKLDGASFDWQGT